MADNAGTYREAYLPRRGPACVRGARKHFTPPDVQPLRRSLRHQAQWIEADKQPGPRFIVPGSVPGNHRPMETRSRHPALLRVILARYRDHYFFASPNVVEKYREKLIGKWC